MSDDTLTAPDAPPPTQVDAAAEAAAAVPVDAEGYDIQAQVTRLPGLIRTDEGHAVLTVSPEDQGQIKATAHALGLAQGDLEQALGAYAFEAENGLTTEAMTRRAEITRSMMTRRYGVEEASRLLDGASRWIRDKGGQEAIDLLEASGLGNNWSVIDLAIRHARRAGYIKE